MYQYISFCTIYFVRNMTILFWWTILCLCKLVFVRSRRNRRVSFLFHLWLICKCIYSKLFQYIFLIYFRLELKYPSFPSNGSLVNVCFFVVGFQLRDKNLILFTYTLMWRSRWSVSVVSSLVWTPAYSIFLSVMFTVLIRSFVLSVSSLYMQLAKETGEIEEKE